VAVAEVVVHAVVAAAAANRRILLASKFKNDNAIVRAGADRTIRPGFFCDQHSWIRTEAYSNVVAHTRRLLARRFVRIMPHDVVRF